MLQIYSSGATGSNGCSALVCSAAQAEEAPKLGSCLHQTALLKNIQNFGQRMRRTLEGRCLLLDHPQDEPWSEVNEVEDEGVGVKCHHFQWGQSVPWEVPDIGRDDRLGPAANGCGHDVAVSLVR